MAARTQFGCVIEIKFSPRKMTPQESVDFLANRVGHERANATPEVRRSFAGNYGPLHQIAYMMGGLQFYNLHRELVDSTEWGLPSYFVGDASRLDDWADGAVDENSEMCGNLLHRVDLRIENRFHRVGFRVSAMLLVGVGSGSGNPSTYVALQDLTPTLLGDATIAVILAEFGRIERFTNAKALAAYVGVAPRLRQSGQWKGRTMLCKTGRSQLRKAFFMPALVALRYNPVFIELNKRLTAAGKPKMAIVGAAMRKLIHVIYGVLKTQTPLDPKMAAPGLDL